MMTRLVRTALVFSIIMVIGVVSGLSQEPRDDVDPLTISELDGLRVSVVLKDVLLAQKDVMILRDRLAASQNILNARTFALRDEVEKLRKQYKRPSGEYSFDFDNLRFVKIEVRDDDGAPE